MPSLSDAVRGRIAYGGDYNPEQWPEDVWDEDVRLMREAGVTLVTVGVFSWARLEPRPGARDFGWLDRVLDLLHAGGVGVCLATPTASPPPWMGARHPETLPRDENGTTVWYGSRNQFCASSPTYREHALRITEDLAARYAEHPALRMWHVGNEYGTHCWCDQTARHFRRWLRERYGTLDALNDAWGTAFWSQRYDSWEELIPPRRAQYHLNPTQLLDFRRFTSDALLECFTAERDVLRRHTPGTPVTTNFMPLFAGQDGWRWAAEEDVVSVDLYPDARSEVAGAAYGALVQDLTRSQAGGPWALLEQATGAVTFRGVNPPKPAGLLRLWSLQAVARGADAVCFFQWRASRQGSEKFHSAMVSHAGAHGRTFQQVRQLGADLAALDAVTGSPVPAEVAVLHDWDSWWASGAPGRPSNRLDHAELLGRWHAALWAGHRTTDLAHPEGDLCGYRLVVVPNLYLLSDTALDRLTGYVHAGGSLVCGFFSGVVDGDDRVRAGGVDARLRDLLGLATVHDWWPLESGERRSLASAALGTFRGELWSEDLETAGARTVAHYTDGELAGRPAITRHTAGSGTAWYVSTLPEPNALRALLERAATVAGVPPTLPGLPAEVEAVRRGELLFLLHHGQAEITVALDPPGTRPTPSYTDVLTGALHRGHLTLGRYGVAVLREST